MSMHHLKPIGGKFPNGILIQKHGKRGMKSGISYKLRTMGQKRHSTDNLGQTLIYHLIHLFPDKYLIKNRNKLYSLLIKTCQVLQIRIHIFGIHYMNH
jgi:hypothetical protein